MAAPLPFSENQLRLLHGSTEKKIGAAKPAPEAGSPVLTEAERHKILVEWNRTERDFPQDKCVHQLVEEQVERTPEAVAVVFEGDSLTYRELNIRANRLAHHLRGLGVGPESLVALCLERSLEMLVAICGTMKAGGAYVPIYPAYPADRVAYMLADANASVILTQESLRERLPATEAKIICLDTGWDIIERESEVAPATDVTTDNLAYVIYTSGSTGQPKGVMNTHGGIVNRLLWMQDEYRLAAGDAVLQKTPFSFDISVWEFFWPLLAGARLVIARPDGHRDSQYLIRLISSEQIATLHFVPSMLRRFLLDPEVGGCASLRRVFCSGEALPWDLQEAFFDRLPGVALHNLYGPTEAAVEVTHWTCKPNSVLRVVPIGRPIANIQIYILDEARQPVAVGVTGELYIGGVGVARGYHHRPELTAERFVSNPFSFQPSARLFRTGDLARYLPDGNIEFLGRMDQQVKIRGFRIELGEIESVLRTHPALSTGAVVARPDDSNEMSLIAFVVARDGAALSVDALRSWLGQKLPDYMIPSRFVVRETLPLMPNGKLDRKALAKLEGTALALATEYEYVAPRSDLERQLAVIWQAVLQQERVGVRDDFFELGGHSLLAISMVWRITSLLKRQVRLRWLFEHRTIESLARQIQSDGKETESFAPIERADRQQALPMSFGQQRMWLVQQTLPEPATYNQPVAYRLRGAVDTERVRKCLKVILDRHEVLRTSLVREGDRLVQRTSPVEAVVLPWKETDLRAVPLGQRQAVTNEQMAEEVRRPFDLNQAPLWRALCIILGAEEHVLALTFHHSLVDEWSLRLFFKELEQLYAAGAPAELAGLPELPLQYADFGAWQRGRLAGESLARLRAYWLEELKDLPPALELPIERARPAQRSGRGAVHRFQLSGAVMEGLRVLARQEATSLFSLMLGAFLVWLHRHTGQSDIIVGTPVANRERPEVQSLIGFFLNMLPVRMRLEGDPGFRKLLRRVREQVHGALEHGELPFEQIVEVAARGRMETQTPLYQAMFVLLEQALPKWKLDQAEARALSVHTGTSKSNLVLSVCAEGAVWECELEYATDLFTAAGVDRMAARLVELLQAIVANPDEAIGRLNLLPAAERHQVLVEWNQTERDYPRDKCVHQLFEEQAERTPEAVAVVFEEQSLTYGNLNQKANHLACHLRCLGVGPGELVGLRVERSFEMIIGVLGVLKAGGAYWALEENLPEERFRLMLADAQPRVLLVCRKSVNPLPAPTGTRSADSPAGTRTVAAIEDLLESSPGGTIPAAQTNQAVDPVYVSYTSGSTGRPKGVVVPHRAVVRLVKGTDYVSLTAEDRLLHLSPLSFDASTFELWGALLNGGRVVLLPPGPPGLAEIGEAIRRNGVTTLWLTAGLFHLMVDERVDDLKPLRQLLAGGDVLSPEHVIKARRALPGCRIVNGYGPTENTTFTCCYTVVDEQELNPSVPIGRPIANTRVYVLDAHLKPVPVGVVGELYAGGDGVACGYLHRPQLTTERFIPDSFSGKPGARLYRTGDLARWRAEGNLEFVGRFDQQIKIRGFRVEGGEIESVLGTHPGVSNCAVVVQQDRAGDKCLAAFLVARDGAALSVDALRSWLGQKLPDYMIPSRFVVMEALPLMPNGKLDRKALTKLNKVELAADTDAMSPRNELESKLVAIWQDVLRLDQVGIHDDFFALGGHSLLAVRMLSRVQDETGVMPALNCFFAKPRILNLSAFIEEEKARRSTIDPGSTKVVEAQTPLFLLNLALNLESAGLADRRYYVIPFPDYTRSREQCRVEFLAEKCLEKLRTIQPRGPYILAGYSLGGLVVYEMAFRLRAEGEVVPLVVIIDTQPATRLHRVALALIGCIGSMLRVPFQLQLFLAGVWSAAINRLWRVRHLLGPRRRSGWLLLRNDLARLKNIWRSKKPRPAAGTAEYILQTKSASARSFLGLDGFTSQSPLVWTHHAYKPRSYDGPVALFEAEAGTLESSAPNCDWKQWTSRLQEYSIPGDHISCVTQYKNALLEKLRICLATVDNNTQK